MDYTGGGWLWLVINVGMVAALGAGIFYGYRRWRSNWKSPADRRREREAIDDLYSKDTK